MEGNEFRQFTNILRLIYISFYSLNSRTRNDTNDCKEKLIAMVVFLCFGSCILQCYIISR